MKQYIDLMKDILDNGINVGDRTGTGRRKVFGRQLRFDLTKGEFPLATTCQTPFKNVVKETLWFITGSTSNKVLTDNGVNIWDLWAVKESDIDSFLNKYFPEADEEGKAYLKANYMENGLDEIGNMYGKAWREVDNQMFNQLYPTVNESEIAPDRLKAIKEAFETEKPQYEDNTPVDWETYLTAMFYRSTDQLQELLVNLRKRPFSSRHVITTWIPEFIPFEHLPPQENVLLGRGALAPCHVLQQYLVLPPKEEGGKNRLSLMMTQRSCDYPVGARTNIAQYAMLLMMVAQVSNMEPFEFIYSLGDTHIYLDQIEKAKEHILREPQPLPKLWINPDVMSIYEFTPDDFRLDNYNPLPNLKYPLSV